MPSSTDTSSTKPGRDGWAASNLRDQFYVCFVPKRLAEIRKLGKQRNLVNVQSSHYPRYSFVGVPLGLKELGAV
jgi:hypothetical protein